MKKEISKDITHLLISPEILLFSIVIVLWSIFIRVWCHLVALTLTLKVKKIRKLIWLICLSRIYHFKIVKLHSFRCDLKSLKIIFFHIHLNSNVGLKKISLPLLSVDFYHYCLAIIALNKVHRLNNDNFFSNNR